MEIVLAVQEGSGRVLLFDSANPAAIRSVAVGDKPHEIELSKYAVLKLTNAPGVVLYGPTDPSRRGAAWDATP